MSKTAIALAEARQYDAALEVADDPAVVLLVRGIALLRSKPEEAKDLISEASRGLTGTLKDKATVKLTIAYSWTGEYAEGLALVDDLLSQNITDEIRFEALLAKATLQMGTPKNALATLNKAEQYIDHASLIHRGCWHNQRGRVLKTLKEYDKAVIEYAGAAVYFEEAGDQSCAAMSLNNEAAVYIQWGKYDEAHDAVKRAVAVYTALHDPFLPHAQDHEAQILIAKGHPDQAKTLIDKVIASVEHGDKKELLLECLLTRARALADLRLSVNALQDVNRAGELGEYLNRPDLKLLVAKVRKEVTGKIAIQSHIEMVQLALEQSGGAVRVAAQKLGLNHASLIAFIKTHNLDRKNPRRKSLISKSAST